MICEVGRLRECNGLVRTGSCFPISVNYRVTNCTQSNISRKTKLSLIRLVPEVSRACLKKNENTINNRIQNNKSYKKSKL